MHLHNNVRATKDAGLSSSRIKKKKRNQKNQMRTKNRIYKHEASFWKKITLQK